MSSVTTAGKRAFIWLFGNRQTGRITIGQLPNVSLAVFLIAAAAHRLLHPAGTTGAVVKAIAAIALACWAIGELVRGVNPWRRILGGTVLAIELFTLIAYR